MDDFVKDTMQIIDAIKRYKEKYGNTQIIDKHYNMYGTYTGIIENLNNDEKQNCKNIITKEPN